jgi:hypothetical protein
MITKTAGVLSSAFGSIKNTVQAAGRIGVGVGKGARKTVDFAAPAAKGVYRGGAWAAKSVGRPLWSAAKKRPGVALATGAAGLTGALGAKDQMRKTLLHTDPNYDLTRRGFMSIDYKDPGVKRYMESDNSGGFFY